MKRMIATLLIVLASAPAMAQEQDVNPGTAPRAFDVAAIAAATAAELASLNTEQPRPIPPPPPAQRERVRRRGSMVGYVDDAQVGSKVRIRFDSGFENPTPDRAEFFYAKCGCYADLDPTNVNYDPDAPGPRPAIASDLNFQQLYFSGEYAPTSRFSVFAQMPIRWIQPQQFIDNAAGFANQSGLSDLRAGVKLGLSDDVDRSITVQLQMYMPTGDAVKGLGTDHASLEPALLFYQRVSERVVLESQFGAWLPFGGSDGLPITAEDSFSSDVIYYGIGPSVEIYSTDRFRFAPVVELVGWRVLGGFASQAGDVSGGTNIVNLKIGARAAFNDQGSFYIGYGKALTDAKWYDDILRLEYRFAF